MITLLALLLVATMMTTTTAMRIHPALQMREEGETAAAAADEAAAAAYAADGDDGLGLDRRPLRSFLVVRPAAAADAAADDRLRLGGGGGEEEAEEEGSFFSQLMHNIDGGDGDGKHSSRTSGGQRARVLLAPPEVQEIAEPWYTSQLSAKSIPRKRNNNNGLSLSVLNNMDVLREKLMREIMARRNQGRRVWEDVSASNRNILDNIG